MITALCLLASANVAPAATRPSTPDTVARGQRLYLHGIDADGEPVRATSMDDVPVHGAKAACVNCHRPSGLGSSEGGYYVPPVNGALLFAPRKLDRRRLFRQMFYEIQPDRYKARLYQPHMRPAYTRATLARVLRDGVDPAGTRLASIMPRYKLSDADVDALDAYLHELSARQSPGVSPREIHFATVFSDAVPEDERDAMLETLRAYVAYRNLHLHEDLARNRFSAYNRSEFVPIERHWTLDVWQLHGGADTWRKQLDAYYRKGPVFALVGGKVLGSWSGPGAFCDKQRLPCLFPDTDLPAWPQPPRGYTMYFSAGLALDARVAARYLAEQGGAVDKVIQVAANDPFGQLPARWFAQALHARRPGLYGQTIVFHDPAQLRAALDAAGAGNAHLAWVVWPGQDVQPLLRVLADMPPSTTSIVLPGRAITASQSLPVAFQSRLRFVDANEPVIASHPRSFETRAWLHARRLGTDHIRLRFKAYYAATLLDSALFDIGEDYYRDYLIERIEDQSQKDLNPGMYPRLTLSPGQRFAAKVAEIVRLDPAHTGRLIAESDWMTP